ncbi:MAG: alpha/beta hydrolase [Cyanobacteria bacterium P01_H01_bin.21]
MDGLHLPSSTAEPQSFTLSDGRRLTYQRVGDPQGQPVFFFHGSPGSRLDSLSAQAVAQTHGWQIVAPDRPGMGRSDFKPYSLLDYVDDICELADSLGWTTFGVMGHSGGGTTLLSCAYAIPDRLIFALDLGGWGPVTVAELRSQMTSIDQFFAERCIPSAQAQPAQRVPWLFQIPFTLLGLSAKMLPPAMFVGLLNGANYFCEADSVLLSTPEVANFLAQTVRESFAQGGEGPAYDALLRYQDWGFKLEEISMPVHIFHGTEDISAPYSFAVYKHRHLLNSQLHSYPQEGHFFLWSHWNDIIAIASNP